MVTNVPHRECVDAESVILAVVAAEAVIRYPVAVVAAALLPRVVFGLPAARAIVPPSGLLLVHTSWAALLNRSVVLPLPALLLLILLRSSLPLLLTRRVILALTPLFLLIVADLSLLLMLSCRVVLPVLLRLPLLTLLLLGQMPLLLL